MATTDPEAMEDRSGSTEAGASRRGRGRRRWTSPGCGRLCFRVMGCFSFFLYAADWTLSLTLISTLKCLHGNFEQSHEDGGCCSGYQLVFGFDGSPVHICLL